MVWAQTQGQAWLVNALAYEACFRNKAPVGGEAILDAREQSILRRETHLEQLTDKLREARVHGVVAPLLSGEQPAAAIPQDGLQYVRDLGLVRPDNPIEIANPIYREVTLRALTYTTEATITNDPTWYVAAVGALQAAKLLQAFREFFRENSEHWTDMHQYKEAVAQLLLQGFLQRIVNGGGRIEREYGLGRMRTDLLILWPLDKRRQAMRKLVIECKLAHRSQDDKVQRGLAQTQAYRDRCGADEGHLLVFDRAPGKPWAEQLHHKEQSHNGVPITLRGL